MKKEVIGGWADLLRGCTAVAVVKQMEKEENKQGWQAQEHTTVVARQGGRDKIREGLLKCTERMAKQGQGGESEADQLFVQGNFAYKHKVKWNN